MERNANPCANVLDIASQKLVAINRPQMVTNRREVMNKRIQPRLW